MFLNCLCQLIDDNTCLQDQLVKLGDEHDQLRNSIIDQMKRVTVERDQVRTYGYSISFSLSLSLSVCLCVCVYVCVCMFV